MSSCALNVPSVPPDNPDCIHHMQIFIDHPTLLPSLCILTHAQLAALATFLRERLPPSDEVCQVLPLYALPWIPWMFHLLD